MTRRPYIARPNLVADTYSPGFFKAEFQRIQAGIPDPIVNDLRDYSVPEGSLGGRDFSGNIQRAFRETSAAGGGIIQAPAGILGIGSSINPDGTANVIVQGMGPNATTFQPLDVENVFSNFPAPDAVASWANPPVAFAFRNLGFRDLSINMRYDVIPDNGVLHPSRGTHSYAADNYQYPFYLLYGDGVWFENVWAGYAWNNGAEFYGCNRVFADHRTWFDHCGDKANYRSALGAGLELDAFTHGADIFATATNCGNGFVMNASNNNASPDGVAGARQIHLGGTVRNCTLGGVSAQGYIDDLRITTSVRTAGTVGIIVSNAESTVEGAKGARNIVVDATVTDYNTTKTAGVGAIDITGAGVQITARLENSITGATGAMHGVIVRPLVEQVSGSPVTTHGRQVVAVTARGSFHDGYAVLVTDDYADVGHVMVHDTSGTMIAPVDNAGAHSTTGSVITLP